MIISLSAGGAGFAIGAVFAVFAIGILRPNTYDDAWRDGYKAGREDAREGKLDGPATYRRGLDLLDTTEDAAQGGGK